MSITNPFFPEYSFRKRNYSTYTIYLDSTQNTVITTAGADFLDILSTNADITKVYVSINDNTSFVPLLAVIPAITPISIMYLKWDSSQIGNSITFLFGYELFRSSKNAVSIVNDLVGLAKDSTLSNIYNTMIGTLTFNTINVSVGTTAAPITTTSTLVSMLLIQNNSTTDVYLGTSTLQNIKIAAGGSMSLVAPLGKKFDLSTLYLYASASTTVGVMYA